MDRKLQKNNICRKRALKIINIILHHIVKNNTKTSILWLTIAVKSKTKTKTGKGKTGPEKNEKIAC